MNQSLIFKLDADFAKYPVLVAGPASETDIDKIESFAGFPLPEDYREFIARYGSAIVGAYSIFGVGASVAMGDDESSAILMTNRFRSQRWPGCEDALVVSMDLAGNAITLNGRGYVNRYDHDSRLFQQIAISFENFIVDWCLNP